MVAQEKFTYARPDLQLLRGFCRDKFGWAPDKVDQLLLPVLKVLPHPFSPPLSFTTSQHQAATSGAGVAHKHALPCHASSSFTCTAGSFMRLPPPSNPSTLRCLLPISHLVFIITPTA